MAVRGMLVGRELLLSDEGYLCGRCGLEGRARKDRLYDERGRRRVVHCRDCYSIVAKEERNRQKALAS